MSMETTWREIPSRGFWAVPVLCALALVTGCVGIGFCAPPYGSRPESPAVTLPGKSVRPSDQTRAMNVAPEQILTQPSLTLDDAVSSALAHNPGLQVVRKRIDAAAGRTVQARLWPNPELEVTAEDVPVESGGLSRSKNLIGLSQIVPFPGKRALDGRAAGQGVRVAEFQYQAAERELVRDVKSAFYRVLAAERRIEIAEELVRLADSLAGVARKRVEAGAAAAQEQLRAEIELERTKTELAGLRSDLAEARQSLATLMGQPDRRDATLTGSLPDGVESAVIPQAREQLLRSHPAIGAAVAGKERAELEWQRAKFDPLPDVTFGVAGGRDFGAQEPIMDFRVSLPLPLIDRAQGRQREARANEEITRAELTATEQRLLREWVTSEAKFRAATEQVSAYRDRILPKAEEALRMVQRGFEEGKFDFIDLLDTQRTVAESRLAYVEKLLELNSARSELEAWSYNANDRKE